MAKQTIAIVGGVVVLLAVAGGGAFLVLNQPTQRPVSPTIPAVAGQDQKPPLAAATPPATTNASPAVAATTPDGKPEIEFEPIDGQFTIVKPTAAYVAPSLDAPQMYPLQPGIGVRAAQESKDKMWVVTVTEDGQAAYLPIGDLGPYQADAENSVPIYADSITGAATVLDTATLQIDDKKIPLFGVIGETGRLADLLQDQITAAGSLTCTPHDQTYVCLFSNGYDIARIALYNGLASPSADASDDYRQQTEAAKRQHAGRWR